MNLVRCAMLYAGFALCANAALADQAAVEALRKGDMEKLVFVSPAKSLPDAVWMPKMRHNHWKNTAVLGLC